MVPVTPSTWLAFYGRNRDDNGAFQKLATTDLGRLAELTKTHLDNALAFTDTITGSAFGNMLLVPGNLGKVHILHHGFSCVTPTGPALIFIQGNLSDCSYFKILPREAAVEQIKGTTGTRSGTTNCPTLAAMLGAASADEFKTLPAEASNVLQLQPNHLMINPDVFVMANGASTVAAKTLAFVIISWFRGDPEEERDEELELAKAAIAKGAETLLAMLWAVENGGLTPVILEDVMADPVLNQIIRNVKGKLVVGSTEEYVNPPPTDQAQANAFALSSQSIVTELNRMHEDRTAEQSLRESRTSLLKTLDPVQMALFTSLCTTDLSIPPEMSQFMTTLTKSKTPQKAIGLLKNRALDWEGTFAEGCCHRLLANGFLSLETNRANPGGFTVFMFHPRTVDMGGRTFDSSTATLREYFGMDVEDSTVAYYAKQGFFHPTNSHDLRIQLQTALDMLELLTCKDSVATKGLHYILHPPRWRRYATEIHDRFVAEKSFGTKFLYSIDRTLQTYFRRMARVTEDDPILEGSPTFLLDHAIDLISKLESGSSITVTLPASLLPKAPTPVAKKAKANPPAPAATPKKAAPIRHHTEEHVNKHVYADWLIEKGADFLDLFKDRAPGARNWPKFLDARLPKKNRMTKSAPMCVRFQMTGTCTYGCQLAHIFAKDMSQPEFNQADRIFKEVRAPKPT
jgi:hypothetical protein